MYQQNVRINFNYLSDPKKEFYKVIKIFKECTKTINLNFDKDNSKFDISKSYRINWACLWNKPINIGKKCTIVQKNNELALIIFEDDTEITQDKFYRLEDLSINLLNTT